MNRLREILVTGLGTGYLPLVPGTWGSMGACGVFLLAAWLSGCCLLFVNIVLAVTAVISSVVCVRLGRFAAETFGGADPRKCTADEWAGQAVALLGIPLGAAPGDLWIAAGVALGTFRFMDVLKPPPVRQFEKLPGGWGVLADDLAAGVLANAAAQLILRVSLGW